MKMLKNVVIYCKQKHGRTDEKKMKEIQDRAMKVLDMNTLTGLFDQFSDLLIMLEESDLSQRIKNIASTWFSCYEEDFRHMDKKISA
jgi:hypothetical protein